jgi:glycosyltransferase involved in cell wall biosynthesis
VRVAVYTDYVYYRDGEDVFGERAFVLFLARLEQELDGMVVLGRLSDDPGRARYRLPDRVRFVGLPHYASLTRPGPAIASMVRSLHRFWRALDDVDAVWLLGPYIHAIAFALLARVRGVPVTLGVRQDLPVYTRERHPGRRWLHYAADALDWTWRRLGRSRGVVAVGPDLARQYAASRRVLPIAVSLVSEAEIASESEIAARSPGRPLRVISVGRLDREKNPVMLADVLAGLRGAGVDARLVVCGEGPLEDELRARLAELGVAEHAELLGYVSNQDGLGDLYRGSDALLHVSWTEGVPQVIFEAFAAGIPIVATRVGGVAEAVGDAALLVAPGDPQAAAEALARVLTDADLRARLVAHGLESVRRQTIEAEVARVAGFIAER